MTADVEAIWEAARGVALAASIPPERLEDPLSAHAHLLRTGQPPLLGDEVPPWRYRGWLRLLVQQLHAHCEPQTGFPDRWGYLFEALAANRLPTAPIPRVEFSAAHDPTLKATDKWVGILDRAMGRWDSFRDFVRFLAYGLEVLKEDPVLPDPASEDLYRTVDLGQWLKYPSDYLGEVAMQRFGGGPHAFFATPHPLCELMVQQIIGDGDNRSKSVQDPAMGTGRMLLHASNHCLRLAGQDIDEVMVLCTKVNLAVYAPWGLYPLPFLKTDDFHEAQMRRLAAKGLC